MLPIKEPQPLGAAARKTFSLCVASATDPSPVSTEATQIRTIWLTLAACLLSYHSLSHK